MQQTLKENLLSAMEITGLEIRKHSVYSSKRLRSRLLFSTLGIDLVLDVGANTGQFGLHCRALGYKGEIISFEPVHDTHAKLLKAAAGDPLWIVADRMALGDTPGEVEINVAANSYSSSILPMLDSHLAASPVSAYIQKEKVPEVRLDDYLGNKAVGRRSLLKLDVQGFEHQVLAGAPNFLATAVAVQLEMSLVPLYQGETLMPEIIDEMDKIGFGLWDMESAFRDPDTGRLLQLDGIFTRKSLDYETHTAISH
jgi:FkbM family methyltransferase